MAQTTKHLTFNIITPFKGPKHYLDECIESVKEQKLSRPITVNHHVIIDDNNYGACRNHFESLQKIDPVSSNIIIHLDGDDKLIDPECFNTLYDEYMNDNTWVTYGNYVSKQGSICRPSHSSSFRFIAKNYGWQWSHLRTFRAHLIPYLKEDSMKDNQGKWFSAAPDVAIFLPILELSGLKRVKFIDKDFVYYRIHSGNEHSDKIKLQDQIRCALTAYSYPVYETL